MLRQAVFLSVIVIFSQLLADVGGEDALQKEGVEQGQKGGGDCDGQEEVETHRQGGIQQQRQGDRRGQVGDGQLGAVGEEAPTPNSNWERTGKR